MTDHSIRHLTNFGKYSEYTTDSEQSAKDFAKFWNGKYEFVNAFLPYFKVTI